MSVRRTPNKLEQWFFVVVFFGFIAALIIGGIYREGVTWGWW